MKDAVAEIWAVASYRAGETAQILGLAAALDRPWRRVDLAYLPGAAALGLGRRVTAIGTRPSLAPPWPRLVISAGLKNEPVCRWIQRRSRGHTRLVFLGRTWAPARAFDLVVTTPQYRLRGCAHVLENPLTQHAVTATRLAAAREAWAERFETAGTRLVGVLLGGDSGPYQFTTAYAEELASQLNVFARERPSKFLLTSSSRTPPAFLERLESRLDGAHFVFKWEGGAEENPYFGILACADTLIVTSDSVAMLSEAVACGKRVLVAEVPATGPAGLRARAYRAAMRWGHPRLTRDVARVHERVFALGLARPLTDPGAEPPVRVSEPPGGDHMAATVAAVSSFFG